MKTITKKYRVVLPISLALTVICVSVILKNVFYNKPSVLLVRTKQGPVQGYLENDGGYYYFLGVPYASVNISMPFGESLDYPLYKDVYKGTDENIMCPQKEVQNNTIKGSLDCLRLNIYVPEKASAVNRLPVLVYIFGGYYKVGFVGQHEYGPKYLIKNDIIIVTVSYRLGPYGFMCLDTTEVPGNQGLKDQTKAFKWVKENIAEFGGDPDKITIAGSSSAGQDVLLHLVYDKEKFYNQAIIESGIMPAFTAVEPSDPSKVIKIAAGLGFESNDVGDALNFLSLQDIYDVIASSEKLDLQYAPCVEKNFDGKGMIANYLTPSTKIENILNTALLVGQVKYEKLFQYADIDVESDKFNHVFEDKLKYLFILDADNLNKMTKRVRQFYLGDNATEDKVKRVIDFVSDIDFNYPIQNFLNNCLYSGGRKIYHHVFSYNGGRNYLRTIFKVNPKYEGATHADQIGYLFEIFPLSSEISPEDQLIVNRMTRLWTNFVKYGDPIPVTSELLPVKCEPATRDVITYFEIDKELRCGTNLFHDRMAYWDLFYELNRKYAIKKDHANVTDY